MKKITFKEYYESKQNLLEASNVPPVKSDTHICRIYVNIPLLLEDDKLKLKPNSKIKVVYENDAPHIIMDDTTYTISWSSEKLKDWLFKNSRKLR